MTKAVEPASQGGITVWCNYCGTAQIRVEFPMLTTYVVEGYEPSHRGLFGIRCDPCRALIDALSPEELSIEITKNLVVAKLTE